ncbi:hypothetical protein DF185_14785 [Marinifilum breve]|uniref:Uncharacterized protein n=1 Tax=Marinifilum breve TaxID=2184082 RepID=A0A2V3ZVL8_9BACT|nr:hypothetical protein [Marinifilum breve]PXX99140.1 hypothetical protein DF185_14785 [Marinifilum breve]
MLQFEFDIRDHKINNNEARGKQLALAIAFLVSAVLLYVFNRYFNFLPHGNYLIFVLGTVAVYFIGLLLGCKFLYPKEYLTINSRKLKYKTGWNSKEIKVYLKDINEIKIENHKMSLKLKNKEVLILDLTHFNDHSISVLKNYLNITE